MIDKSRRIDRKVWVYRPEGTGMEAKAFWGIKTFVAGKKNKKNRLGRDRRGNFKRLPGERLTSVYRSKVFSRKVDDVLNNNN